MERANALSIDDEIGLLTQIADMDIDSVRKKRVTGDSYEGQVTDRGFQMFGNIGGRWFEAVLELEGRKVRAGYIFKDMTAHLRN